MKNKNILIGVIISIIVGIVIYISNMAKPEDTVNTYISYINEKNYDGMYDLLSKNSKNLISKEDFISRNKNIYEGIESFDIKAQIEKTEKQKENIKVYYNEEMYTTAGQVKFSNVINLVKENKDYKMVWSSTLIFPELKDNYKVRVKTLKGKRGTIKDRNGNNLAYDGVISSIGIVPGKLGENKEQKIQKIADLLGMSADTINKYLSASYVKEDTFVPIKKISKNATELKEKLLQISGIKITDAEGRVYILGEEAAHLVGYVQNVTAEDLKENEGKGYSSTSLIGKSGLEAIYEDRLKSTDGCQIYIENEQGENVFEIASQEQKDGKDIKITIDSNIQKKLYNQLKEDKGLFTVMNPKTGELLALVSTPSFDSNDFTLGMSNEKWEKLNNDERKPLYNRFQQAYCPGSTFKPVTGAIGLSTGKINPNEDFGYRGTSWQKDSSWGDYKVTTLTNYNNSKNLLNGLLYSDNIYFAQVALKIGSTTLTENLDKLGFYENLEFPINLAQSKYSANENKKIETEGNLADSGFGQGNILVNPIHMASIYSSFVNEGNMIKPILETTENKGQIWKQNVFTKEATETIKNDLVQVVENPSGTANDMKVSGVKIAGKTGTAELKKSKEDKESGTLGWFNCFTVDNSSGEDILVVSMVENIQNNADGGSHYLIKKIKQTFFM